MKAFLVLCGVISVALFVNGFATDVEGDFDHFDLDAIVYAPPTDEQMECIKNGVRQVIDDNPDLQWWFDEVGKSVDKLIAAAQKCESLTGIDKQICVAKLKIQAKLEQVRLIKLLPADKKDIVVKLQNVVKNCMQDS